MINSNPTRHARRIAIVEWPGAVGSGTPTSTKQLVWDGSTIAEERNASNTVTKRFFAQGEQISGSSYYYTRDHLGSVREMTDSSGNIVSQLEYDPWGRMSVVQGTTLPDMQYAEMYTHQPSGTYQTFFRIYDPIIDRWLSRDPLANAEMRQGPNLYDYVMNDPLRFNDPLGLAVGDWWDPSTYGSSSFWQGAGDPNAWQQSFNATANGATGGLANLPIQPGNQYNQCASTTLGWAGAGLILSAGLIKILPWAPPPPPATPPPLPPYLMPPPEPLPPNVIPGNFG